MVENRDLGIECRIFLKLWKGKSRFAVMIVFVIAIGAGVGLCMGCKVCWHSNDDLKTGTENTANALSRQCRVKENIVACPIICPWMSQLALGRVRQGIILNPHTNFLQTHGTTFSVARVQHVKALSSQPFPFASSSRGSYKFAFPSPLKQSLTNQGTINRQCRKRQSQPRSATASP